MREQHVQCTGLAELIFERIKHGDDEHRAWLKAKAVEIAAEYDEYLASGGHTKSWRSE